MFNPSEPNTTREITLSFVTDENGEMEINITDKGFEENPSYIPLFLLATLETLKVTPDEGNNRDIES